MSYPQRDPVGRSPVLHWREGGVAHLRFNRPEALNAIDPAMAQAFLRACQDIAQDGAVRAVLVSAEGRNFMAGGDLAAMRPDPVAVADALIEGMHGGIRLLAAMEAPVLASVQGAVAGGGLGLVLGCDLVVAADDANFKVAYPLIGASADCSTSWSLPRLVGFHKAMELALLSEPFDALEALSLGIVNRVVPATRLAAEAARLSQQLADGPTKAYGRLKSLIRASFDRDLHAQLDAEADAFRACAADEDFKEGLDAFLGKRSPTFRGR